MGSAAANLSVDYHSEADIKTDMSIAREVESRAA